MRSTFFQSMTRHLDSGALKELTVTTNGSQLRKHARALADAKASGLSAINITLGHVFGEGDDAPFEYTVGQIGSHDAMIRHFDAHLLKVLSTADIEAAAAAAGH